MTDDLAIPPPPDRPAPARAKPLPKLVLPARDQPAWQQISDLATALLGIVSTTSRHQACPSLRLALTAMVTRLDEIASAMGTEEAEHIRLRQQARRLAEENIRRRRVAIWMALIWFLLGVLFSAVERVVWP
jgi:hypothetical protein